MFLHDWLRHWRQQVARPTIESLQQRIAKLEAALEQTKRRNQELAQALNEQKQKTRELYAKTKEYAARLNVLR